MNIQTKTGTETIDQSAITRAEEKLRKIARLLDESLQEAQVTLDYSRESGSTSSDTMWRVSVRLVHDGKEFHAAETEATPEAAADEAIYELTREIKRVRGKETALLRRGGALLKRMLRRG